MSVTNSVILGLDIDGLQLRQNGPLTEVSHSLAQPDPLPM